MSGGKRGWVIRGSEVKTQESKQCAHGANIRGSPLFRRRNKNWAAQHDGMTSGGVKRGGSNKRAFFCYFFFCTQTVKAREDFCVCSFRHFPAKIEFVILQVASLIPISLFPRFLRNRPFSSIQTLRSHPLSVTQLNPFFFFFFVCCFGVSSLRTEC